MMILKFREKIFIVVILVFLFMLALSCGSNKNETNSKIKVEDTSLLEVISTSPSNNDVDVPIDVPILVTFSKIIKEESLTAYTFHLNDGLTGKIIYNNDKIKIILPKMLAYNTQYIVTIKSKGIIDLSGKKMKDNYTWKFTTAKDKTLPEVVSTMPSINAKKVAVDTKITVTFSKVMDSTTINTSTLYLNGGVKGDFTYKGTTVIFTPSSFLDYDTEYTATITTRVRAITGNAVDSNYVWKFTTKSKIEIAPLTAEILVMSTKQFTAICKDSEGDEINNAKVVWSSSDTTIATIDSTGLVTGIKAGSVVISAKVDDVESSANLIVKDTSILTTSSNFTLNDIYGKKVSLSDYSGKVIILDFFATWCGPCKAEIPDFVALYNQYKGQGLVIIGVDVDLTETASILKTFASNYSITYPILLGTEAVENLYGGIQYIPTTFIIDRNNKIVKSYVGAKSKSVFEDDIKKLL